MEFSWNPNISLQRCLNPIFQLTLSFSVNQCFLRICQSPYKKEFVYIPPCVGKIFKFMVFTFLENALNLGIFTKLLPHSKLAPKFLSSRSTNSRKRWKKLWFALSKFNQKMTWDIWLFVFCIIFNFSNVMVLQKFRKNKKKTTLINGGFLQVKSKLVAYHE